MKKYLFAALVLALSAGTITAFASVGPITRLGVAYNGAANPGHCVIEADDLHPTELRVDCRQSDQAARVRFRFLKDVGFVRSPATVTADLHVIKGSCNVAWMVPVAKSPARTARVLVSPGSYCHIRTVTASQP